MTLAPGAVRALEARGFRNLAPLALEPGPRFNVVWGENGQGKSNLLEALRYVTALESFRGAGTDELVQVGAEGASLRVELEDRPLSRRMEVRLGRGAAREVRLDGKRPRSTLAWLGVAPTVLFHPGDLALAQGPPDGRRALVDRVLAEMDPTYGATLASYLKALRSRNRLLRTEGADRRAITAYDPVLAGAGAVLVTARESVLAELAPRAERAFEAIVGDAVPVSVRYRPRVSGGADALREALARSLEKDLARGFTGEGPHADEIELAVKTRSAKHHASQGQQRALVLGLRVAELEVLTARTGKVPVLLLDDVSSELDAPRTARLFALLGRLGGQVFLTTTRPSLIEVEGERVDLRVAAGRVERAA